MSERRRMTRLQGIDSRIGRVSAEEALVEVGNLSAEEAPLEAVAALEPGVPERVDRVARQVGVDARVRSGRRVAAVAVAPVVLDTLEKLAFERVERREEGEVGLCEYASQSRVSSQKT